MAGSIDSPADVPAQNEEGIFPIIILAVGRSQLLRFGLVAFPVWNHPNGIYP